MENSKTRKTPIIAIGGLLLASAVALGAFGAHGLESILEEHGRVDTYETAVKYHFYHGLGMVLIGILKKLYKKGYDWACKTMLVGVIIFSGSLYVLSLSNVTWLGAITPIGGVLLILSWILVAKDAFTLQEETLKA
jgi:uncharacterized membrane protein YgdD (TMEM256/DUF423 family)